MAIILAFGTEEIEVEKNEGQTLSQLVAEHADELGIDPERITNFRKTDTLVSGSIIPEDNVVYRLSINSESKGIN